MRFLAATSCRVLALVLPLALCIALPAQSQTLAEAMQRSLDAHPEIKAGAHARLSVEEQLKAARAGYLPQVDVLAGRGRQGSDTPGTRTPDRHDYVTMTRSESTLQVKQMLFDGFATRSEVARQRATVNARAYELQGSAERIGLAVVQVYLDVLKRHELVRLAEVNLANHQRILEQIALRSERGVGRLVDLNQAKARLALAQNNLSTEKTNLADAQVNYFSVVGQDPVDLKMPTGISGPAGVADPLPASLATARQELLGNSPHLSAAEADIGATEAQYTAARSTFYPRVDAELSLGADNNIDAARGHRNDWQLMVRMRYNLFAGGRNSAELRSKSHQVNQAKDIRDNALRVLNEDLGLAWNALLNAREQFPIAQQYAEQSQRVRDSYRKQFTLGDRTLLDLLDSENELFTAARRLEDVRFVELFTQYRIKSNMGSLLKSQGVVTPTASVPLDIVKTNAQLPLPLAQ
jgi:adhesin transport system outer membrane protein